MEQIPIFIEMLSSQCFIDFQDLSAGAFKQCGFTAVFPEIRLEHESLDPFHAVPIQTLDHIFYSMDIDCYMGNQSVSVLRIKVLMLDALNRQISVP